jgi:outer membrane protein
MKKLMQISLLTAGWASFALAGQAAEQKIATMDLRKAIQRYYKTIQSTAALTKEASEMEKEHSQMVDNAKKHEEEYHKLIDKANDQAISAEERDKAKKTAVDIYTELEADKQSINQFDQMAKARLEEKDRQRLEDIEKEITGVVEAHAKAAGYSKVIDSSGISANLGRPVLIYTDGQDDMTETIIKELNAAAPPGSLETNTPATLSSTNLMIRSPGLPK